MRPTFLDPFCLLRSFAVLLALLATASATTAQDCRWEPGFTMSGLDYDVRDLATRVTPSGVEIVAAGEFLHADGQRVNRVARWNGTRWEPLEGPQGVGVDGPIQAVKFFDTGSGPEIYVVGQFDTAGGVTTYNIARWNGSAWAPVGAPHGLGGPSGHAVDLEVIDDGSGPTLYAVGRFTGAGNSSASDLARWDGQSWSAVGSSPGSVTTLTYGDIGDGPTFFVGEYFGTVSQYRDQEWQQIGEFPFFSRQILDLVIWDDGSGPALYAAGEDVNSFPSGFVARWNGSEWIDLPNLGYVLEYAEVDELLATDIGGESVLIAAGTFRELDFERIGHIAAWNGTEWTRLEGAPDGLNSAAYALEQVAGDGDPYLLVGGSFNFVGDVTASRIVRWDGATWTALTSDVPYGLGVDDPVYQYISWDDGNGESLYMAGNFEIAGGRRVNNIARWSGTDWEPLAGPAGIGTDGWIDALAVWDDGTGSALYVGGYFETAGGVTAHNVAKWNGSKWSALTGPSGTGVNSSVRDLIVWDDGNGPALYVAGTFGRAGEIEAGPVARWDGTDWSGLDEPHGPSSAGVVLSMEVFDDGGSDALFVSGYFGGTDSDGSFLDATAKWDGLAWHFVGRGFLSEWVEDLEIFDDGTGPALYAAGDDGDLARYNGFGFEQVSDGLFQWIRDLQVWDDGTGAKLYAAGRGLADFPGLDADYIAAWDGTAWSPLGDATQGEPNALVHALYPWNGDGRSSLMVGGEFLATGEMPSAYAARWNCGTRTTCPAGSDHLLCIGDQDRFAVEVDWRDFDGNEDEGRVVPFQTNDSGLFYFFDADNWEMLVKVLDACSFNDHFWVFSAATTNVEYNLTVTDTVAGVEKSWFNPLGTAAPALTDTAAFATCDATSTAASGPSKATAPAEAGLATSRAAGLLGEKTECVASDTVMCLENDRFALEIDWRDFEGDAGPGYVVEGTPSSDSGLFQFFGEDNWEVLVKVLDACSFNDRFWVFSAATTNVEYTLRVTDTHTGETVSYFNPLGNAADAVTDTDAFSTCP